MRGYSFKFNKVLNYKENIENVKKMEYGDINQRLITEEEKLVYYNAYKESILAEKNTSAQRIKVGDLKLYNRILTDISSNIKNQEEKISNIKNELEIAKDELIVAMQEKKAFEKLKENGLEVYKEEVKKKEEKIIDGIVTFNNSLKQ